MQIIPKFVFLNLCAVMLAFLITPADTIAMIDFYIMTQNNDDGTHCDYLEIRKENVLCRDHGTLITYSLGQVSQIRIVADGKIYDVKEISEETAQQINTISNQKKHKAKQKVIARKRQKAKKKKNAEEWCIKECLVSKEEIGYSVTRKYDPDCYRPCMRRMLN